MMVVFQGFVLIVCVCALIVLVTLAFFAGCDLFETSDLLRTPCRLGPNISEL
jgi:hypothetical protein